MKKYFLLLFLGIQFTTLAQKDSLQLGDRYAEDQIYLQISYNQFYNQPQTVGKSNFSYGVSTGFLKDISLNKKGTLAFALGVGYGFDSFNHKLKVAELNNETIFSVDNSITSNRLSIHNIEFPIQFRWRTSTANKYSFWRIHTGFRISYNFLNTFSYEEPTTSISLKNSVFFNQWQYGLSLSAGYDLFNVYVYYGLTPILKNAFIGEEKIATKILKFGLVFYLL